MADPPTHRRLAAARLRIGLTLWLLSWTPIPILFGISGTGRYLIWGAQILIGLFGLALAGSASIQAVKSVGWRRAPGVLWYALLHGEERPPIDA